jgi:pimeloyl-ACP methyl ester carboxylesterase
LIVVTSGFDMHMDLGRGGSAGDPPFFLGPAQVGLRRLIRELVLTGFDVLLWDKRNIGFSGGRARESYGTDIFALLDQLEDGVLSLGSDDTTPVWRSGTTLLPDTAKQTPVILWGYSHGGTISMRAMAQNFSGKPIDARFNPDGTLRLEEGSPRGYNFIGIVVQGQVLPPLRFTVSGTGIAAMNKAELRHSGYSTTGDVWNTIPQWPASLFFTGTREEFTIAGSVAMYNQARGFKKLVTIQGDHGDYLLGGFVDHVIEETVDFARQVAAQQSSQRAPHDAGSTTVERAVCGSQPRAVN